MTILRKAHLDASSRLAAMDGAARTVHQHIEERTLHKLESPDRVKLRLKRLLKNPLVEKILENSGVAGELASAAPDQLSVMAMSELERIIEGSDFMPVWFLTRGAELRRTVARIRAGAANGDEMYGSGFLVGPRLLLTNRHVLDWTDIGKQGLEEIAKHSLAEFDFEKQLNGVTVGPTTFRLDPATLLLSSPWNELDYVLVAVEPRDLVSREHSISEYGYNRLAADLGKINKGEPVFIIQHPEGQPKVVIVQGNRLIERRDDSPYLAYEADTESGSSGSPVFNQQWEVIGLHHAPQIARQGGDILAKDDSKWTPEMGSKMVKYLKLNEGIRISYVLNDLAKKRDHLRSAAADLAPPEQCTAEGLRLLEEMLQYMSGVDPTILSSPALTHTAATADPPPSSPGAATPGSTGKRHYPRPD